MSMTGDLADLGRLRFGVMAQSTRNNDRTAARLDGIRDALAPHGLAVRPQHFVTGEWSIAEGRSPFRSVIRAPQHPGISLAVEAAGGSRRSRHRRKALAAIGGDDGGAVPLTRNGPPNGAAHGRERRPQGRALPSTAVDASSTPVSVSRQQANVRSGRKVSRGWALPGVFWGGSRVKWRSALFTPGHVEKKRLCLRSRRAKHMIGLPICSFSPIQL